MEFFNLDYYKTQMKQEEIEKLAEIQTKFLIPVMEENNDIDLFIKIRNGSIVYCEKRGVKIEKIVFDKIPLDK